MDQKNLLKLLLDTDEVDLQYMSSSSEEEELELVGSILSQALRSRHCITNYYDVIKGYNEEEFIRHFRLRRSEVDLLSLEFKNSELYQKLISRSNSRLTIDNEKSILIMLWFAGHRGGYSELADRFDLSLSSVHAVISRVISFLSGKGKDVIKLPNPIERNETAHFFMDYKGFPNVIGCVDGTHFKIDKPSERDVDYFNRKDFYSLNVQLVCNHNKKFTDVCIGYPGSVHDARIFRSSTLYERLDDLCRNGQYLIGDSAYPLSENILVPYRDNGHLSAAQKNFNKKLSGCRVFIENSIGILKERFPQLYHIKLRGHERICNFIRSCIVLHNRANNEDTIHFSGDSVEDEQPIEIPVIENYHNNGQDLRNTICRQIFRRQ